MHIAEFVTLELPKKVLYLFFCHLDSIIPTVNVCDHHFVLSINENALLNCLILDSVERLGYYLVEVKVLLIEREIHGF